MTVQVPTWLNLHAVVSEKMCTELGLLATKLEQAEAAIAELAKEAYGTLTGAEAALNAHDLEAAEVYQAIYMASGAQRVEDALWRLIYHFKAALCEVEEKHWPAWLLPERDRLGYPWPPGPAPKPIPFTR